MKVQLMIGFGLILLFSVVSGATNLNKNNNMDKGNDELTDFLSTLDTHVFDSTVDAQQKYKRALGELDALLGSLMQEINEKQATTTSSKRRTKREIYGGGGGGNSFGGGYGGGDYGGGDDGGSHHGWGQPVQVQHVSHGWSHPPPPPIYKIHHHHHGIPPEFLLKTALILKGILVLGHVAAMG